MSRTFLMLSLLGSCTLQAQTPDAPPELAVSLRQAVEMALAPDGNTRVALAAEIVEQAQNRTRQSRAALLPQVSSSVSQQSMVRNLEAFGVRVATPVPGFEFPRIVGPFNVFDARMSASQSVFDFSAIRRYQASKLAARAARGQELNTRDAVTASIARAYLAALRAQEQVDTAREDVELARSLARLARNQKEAGVGTGIEVTRAEVQLSNQRQTLLVNEQQQRAAQLQLSRLIGLRLSTALRLTTPLTDTLAEPTQLETSLEEALQHRADWKAQKEKLESVRHSYGSVKWERLPSVGAFADYGTIGSSVNNAQPTRAYGVSVNVPIFDGGRRDARRSEAASQVREEELRTRDLREQIELELRLAFDEMESAAEQLQVAEEGRRQAEQELEQAQRRYEAGVGSSIEVTDAQTRLARARQNRIDALYALNVARIDWSEARGQIDTAIP